MPVCKVLCKSLPGLFDECSTVPCGSQPFDQTDQPEPIDPTVNLAIVTTFIIVIYYCLA